MPVDIIIAGMAQISTNQPPMKDNYENVHCHLLDINYANT